MAQNYFMISIFWIFHFTGKYIQDNLSKTGEHFLEKNLYEK